MRGKTLSELLTMLRVEARLSLNASHNVDARDRHVAMLQMEQNRLWADYDWPHLRVERTQFVEAGQYIYDTPSGMAVDRIEKIEFFADGVWRTLAVGVTADNYNAYNTTLDERAWPVSHWRITENEDVEIWPIPDQDGVEATLEGALRFTGTRDLSPLVDDADTCDLDGLVLVLYAAAKILAASGAKDAQLKLQEANQRLARVRGNMTPREPIRLFESDAKPIRSGIQLNKYVPAT